MSRRDATAAFKLAGDAALLASDTYRASVADPHVQASRAISSVYTEWLSAVESDAGVEGARLAERCVAASSALPPRYQVMNAAQQVGVLSTQQVVGGTVALVHAAALLAGVLLGELAETTGRDAGELVREILERIGSAND